jgi:hypothetical protein
VACGLTSNGILLTRQDIQGSNIRLTLDLSADSVPPFPFVLCYCPVLLYTRLPHLHCFAPFAAVQPPVPPSLPFESCVLWPAKMANQSSQSHGYDNGSARNYHGLDCDASHSASCFANESVSCSCSVLSEDPDLTSTQPTNNRTTSSGTQTSHYRASRANDGSNSHSNRGEDADDGRPQSQHGCSVPQGPQYYHYITRSYQAINPEVYRVLQDRTLAEATARLGGRNHSHNRSSTRQQRPRRPNHYRGDSHSPDPYHNSRPLGFTYLRNLNRDRSPTSAVWMRLNEDQRAGPFDNIGQINVRYDYDQRAPHQYGEGYQLYQEDEVYEEYDDRSDTIY